MSKHHFQPFQEAAWSISNITAGQAAQIQAVLDAHLLPLVIDVMIKVITYPRNIVINYVCFYRESTRPKKKLCGL